MVVLTIVTQKNGETVYFDEPISQAHFMKLISCSLYNSWHTLKREGSAVLGDEKKDPSVVKRMRVYKNDCIDTHNLVCYHRTFSPLLAKRSQRYNISSRKRDERGKKI